MALSGVGRLDYFAIPGPGEGDRRRIETLCLTLKLVLLLQHHPLLRHGDIWEC